MAPGNRRSRKTGSPVETAAAHARVVGIPSACIASLTRYSRSTGPKAARPSPRRENGVGPAPFNWTSRQSPLRSTTSPSRIAPTVAELWNEIAELMRGIGHRDRFGAQ